MFPAKKIWKPVIHRLITKQWERFRLYKEIPPFPASLNRVGLYLHVPFCNNLCPFCPYNRIEYDEALYAAYLKAVKKEVTMYAPYLKGHNFVSLYIGGGTPTVNMTGLLDILEHMKTTLNMECDICVELHPSAMDNASLKDLKACGVSMISIGVESTSDNLLSTIGRKHNGQEAIDAIKRANAVGFDSLNVDLMFALPRQTYEEWKQDVIKVINEGVDQISTYPMFSFPYSDSGMKEGLKAIGRPNDRVIRKMLRFTDDYSYENGYKRCAVWSWIKPLKKKFSSITRHHYIGFGPSAASMTGTHFYVNTFDVNEYSKALGDGRPVAVTMPTGKNIEMAYWLYWRVYELHIDECDFRETFGSNESLDEQFGHIIRPVMLTGMMKRTDGGYEITKSGAYWIHRLQNEYSLNYINRLWGKCRREPWPNEVTL